MSPAIGSMTSRMVVSYNVVSVYKVSEAVMMVSYIVVSVIDRESWLKRMEIRGPSAMAP